MKPETLETKLLNRIERKRSDVFLRADRPDPLALCGQLGSRSATSIAGTARGPHIEGTLVSGNFRQFV
jgi:hypothetical protein